MSTQVETQTQYPQAQLPNVSSASPDAQMVKITPDMMEILQRGSVQLPTRPRKQSSTNFNLDPDIVKMAIGCGALVAVTAIVCNSLPNKTTASLIQSQQAVVMEQSRHIQEISQQPKKVCILAYCPPDKANESQPSRDPIIVPDPPAEPPVDYASTQQQYQSYQEPSYSTVIVGNEPVRVPTGY